ncbi:hypothetical protein OM076_07065 [Solirubrobacter ginsenosidimutans]|uniref:Methylamine utilisation protein MauE domain-containing protein n=1 Tax=Solirubrobacter ginsenosidimutans TaxID=490573 RepID=A0A9X3MPP3_9ACTN|nr:MauE/DoxX family redox-associated membrane protein [Solirubrobacter ginsenosidimutans]MDA0160015.1 hypothetical protein [Solirubrobacter ginsenosidimutans]
MSASASGLAVWPGVFLLAGGVAKAREVRDDAVDGGTLLFRAVGRSVPPRPAWAAVAGAELVVGGLVLAGVARPYPQLAGGTGLAAAGALAAWGVRNAPDAGCGCFGARSEPVSPRTAVRAGVLSALALAAATGGGAWTNAFRRPAAGRRGGAASLPRAAAAAVVLGAGAALAATTPELRPRHARARAHDLVCAHRPAPPRRTLERLRQSNLFSDARPYLAADAPSEQWRDGCWRYVSYPANYEGEAATAVFALYLGKSRNADGVAFVAEDEQRVIGQIKGRK